MRIRYLQLKFILLAEGEFRPTRFLGNTIRGALGSSLRNILCTVKRESCNGCPIREQCHYQYLFESHMGEIESLKKRFPLVQRQIPHPFILSPPINIDVIEPGKEMAIGITLFGRSVEFVPYFYLAVERMANRGLGRDRVPFRLISISTGSGYEIFNANYPKLKKAGNEHWSLAGNVDSKYHVLSEVKVKFLTPCRIKSRGRFSQEITFKLLIANILRRLSSIAYFHEGIEPVLNVKELLNGAEKVEVKEDNTRWVDMVRYSARQKTRMRLGGVVGGTVYRGENIGDFGSILHFGEIAGVGKATSFGFGRIEISK